MASLVVGDVLALSSSSSKITVIPGNDWIGFGVSAGREVREDEVDILRGEMGFQGVRDAVGRTLRNQQ